jgi:hypothetical protein
MSDNERIRDLERRVKRLELNQQQNSPEILKAIKERDKQAARRFWEQTTGTKSRL